MTELFLEILVNFGLLREDYKHQRKISKREKADGKKRSFQKYFLQPSSIMIMSALIIGTISAFLFFRYQRTTIFPKKTAKEIADISARLENWKENLGNYPTDLNELIGNSPIRQEWKTDSWNRPYQYTVNKNGVGFLIVSAGLDGKFRTEDDIKSE